MTTLSPSFHGNASATRLSAQEVFGRNAISSAPAPMKRADFRPRLLDVAEGPAPVRGAAVPRVLDVADHRVRDAPGQRAPTAAWLK